MYLRELARVVVVVDVFGGTTAATAGEPERAMESKPSRIFVHDERQLVSLPVSDLVVVVLL